MSTISQTPRIKTPRLIDPRIQSLLLAAAVFAMLALIVANVAVSSEASSMDINGFHLYRQGEWVSVPFTPAQAYQIFRRDEVVSPVSSAEAYKIFRQGEWAFTAADMFSYHISERTLSDPQAGVAAYLLSERTRVPVRFTPHQQSEWFGQ